MARVAWPIAAAVYALAVWARWRDLPAAMMLGDAAGPWLVALGDPLGRRPHAPPYGWGLYPPYALCLALSGSLWQAVSGLHLLHALAAPMTSLAALRLRPGGWAAALAAGALVALDRGLIDTALSGSEGYLGASWVAAAALGLTARDRTWGPPLACAGLAFAAMNHPLAACLAPLLLALPRRRSSLAGLTLGTLLLAPRVLRALGEPLPGTGGLTLSSWQAAGAWLDQGGLGAWALLAAALAGLLSPRSRPLAAGTLLSAAALLGAGLALGYLRDYHLRLLTAPAALGLAGLPALWALPFLLALRPPIAQRPPPGSPDRPGTLGLTSTLSAALLDAPRPLVVDGAWVSGTAAAEPAAISLDLHLRGWPLEDLLPDEGATVAVIVSARRGDLARIDYPERAAGGDRHFLVIGDPAGISEALCGLSPRLGGAWDWVAAAKPGATLEEVGRWWSPCPTE